MGTLTQRARVWRDSRKNMAGAEALVNRILYGSGIADYSAFPVRYRLAEGLIYTLIPTKKRMGEKQIGDEVFLDPPTALVQEAIESDLAKSSRKLVR